MPSSSILDTPELEVGGFFPGICEDKLLSPPLTAPTPLLPSHQPRLWTEYPFVRDDSAVPPPLMPSTPPLTPSSPDLPSLNLDVVPKVNNKNAHGCDEDKEEDRKPAAKPSTIIHLKFSSSMTIDLYKEHPGFGHLVEAH
eukprot:jgi/Psemu1/3717/gm1.3717_g